jgi:predicted dehydrogenase
MNRRYFIQSTMAAISISQINLTKANAANGNIRTAIIGCGMRGALHYKDLLKIPGVSVVAVCDPDIERANQYAADLAALNVTVKVYQEHFKCLEDKDIDAVVITTPNHNHTLISLQAILAGKHVYTEKPVCHNLWEGQQLLKAAELAASRGQVVVHGQQRRSDLGWESIAQYIQEGKLGKIKLARALNYKMRNTIGKTEKPTPVPASINYDLWSAPRPKVDVMRQQFHYDWHWQWAYGCGDIGNQGPHQLDMARWCLGDSQVLPQRVISLGNRWGYQDDGQTPNQQLAMYQYAEGAPILFDNRGLPMKDMSWGKGLEPVFKGIRIGNIIEGENGYIAEAFLFDNEGKKVQKFENFLNGPKHMENFILSVQAGKLINPQLHMSHGYHAAALAIIANISYRLGKKINISQVKERLQSHPEMEAMFDDFNQNMINNKIDLNNDQAYVGPWLEIDPKTDRFIGEFAAEANQLLDEDAYAPGHELPKIS